MKFGSTRSSRERPQNDRERQRTTENHREPESKASLEQEKKAIAQPSFNSETSESVRLVSKNYINHLSASLIAHAAV